MGDQLEKGATYIFEKGADPVTADQRQLTACNDHEAHLVGWCLAICKYMKDKKIV